MAPVTLAPPAAAGPARTAYERRRERLVAAYAAIPPQMPVRLAKRTSNICRVRAGARGPGLERAIGEGSLQGRAEVRFLDYRDVEAGAFDAVSSIGLTAHIGARNLGSYFGFLASKLRPEGRLLNHTITRPTNRERHRASGFIDRYVFPGGELQGPGTIVSEIHDNGFEVRHEENLREHYAMTLREWCRNLERRWDAAVAEIGARRPRAWRLWGAAEEVTAS